MTLPIFDYQASLKCWQEILSSVSDSRKRAMKMLELGVISLGKGQIAFDPILTSEALGEAEKADAKELQAEAYKRIGTMWGKMYPALSLSIWRNAERLYEELRQEQDLNTIRINLALSCFLTGDKYGILDPQMAEKYKNESCHIIQSVSDPNIDESTVASFLFTKGSILGDRNLLKQARSFYEREELWNMAISCLDEEVRIAIDKGKGQEALPLMRLISQYAAKLGDYVFAQDVEEKMMNVDKLHNAPRALLKPAENNNLLDVLDIIAYYEERIIFQPFWRAQKAIGNVMDDKKFILLSDGHLMPKFREQWRLFRGENKYHQICKPALWRDGMDENAVFIERLKFAEFCRVLALMPEVQPFSQSYLEQDPDGCYHQIRLHIDELALAQHYGIKTELLDLTSDKWVAAFFACTNYNNVDDTYSPISTNTFEKGIMYCYPIKPTGLNSRRLRVVGAQPFERPTEQAAFMLKLDKDDNFNDMCTDRSFFCQNPMVSIIVYHFANRAGRMFPQETIQQKTRVLVADKTKTAIARK